MVRNRFLADDQSSSEGFGNRNEHSCFSFNIVLFPRSLKKKKRKSFNDNAHKFIKINKYTNNTLWQILYHVGIFHESLHADHEHLDG